MKTGILVNISNATACPGDIARCAERSGFESLWVGDHIVVPVEMAGEMPGAGGPLPESYAHISDPFVVLAMAAAVTQTLKVGAGACILPCRNPILTAKQATTLDYFSNGRFLFGVGAGWLREQLEVLGADFDHRLAQTREYVAVMKELWGGPDDVASFEGRWTKFQHLRMNPRPATPGGPRILLGTWGPAAPRRVAEWADGWLPMLVEPSELKDAIQQLRVECDRLGRDVREIEVSAFVYDAGGDRGKSQDLLGAYQDAGASRVVLIEGMGARMGAKDWVAWAPDSFEQQLAHVAERYL